MLVWMSLLAKLERRLGWMAVPNITVFIVFGQTCAYILSMAKPGPGGSPSPILIEMALIPGLVLKGEVWRLFSFIFFPPTIGTISFFDNPIFAFFALYFFYFMGQALEANWGTFRYNVYLLIAYVMTLAAAFSNLEEVATNAFIGTSVFLAFAYLFPEFVIYLFLVLPVKVKWLGMLTWVLSLVGFMTGDLQTKLLIVASVVNFLLFFGRDIVQHIRTGHRRLQTQAARIQDRDKPFHVCAVCGITDKTHPKMDFRYCPMCVGSWGYCTEHLHHHEHKTAPEGT